jgi:conjugative relaxase-like TrwC/TraI family protein
MTARTTTLRGPDAGTYYVREIGAYYLDGDEPPGVWHGAAAVELGLSGIVDDDAFLAVMDGVDPSTGRDLGTAHTDKTVRGFDVTFSAPKSLSVLYAFGDPDTRAQVLAAHDVAVATVIDWIEDHAHTRYRVDGQVRVVDAGGIMAVAFREHVSRALDPQIHTHVVIANRVLSPDGRWLALDARTIKGDQRTLSALYHAGVRGELTERLGVQWNDPVNGIAEISDIKPEVLAEFSTRARDVERRLEFKLDRFVAAYDREPTQRERWRMERAAVVDGRPSKASDDAATLAQEWTTRLVTLGIEPDQLVRDTLDQVMTVRLDPDTAGQVMARAVQALSERQSTWRPAEITRELAAAMPTELALGAAEVAELTEGLRERVEHELLVDVSRTVPEGVPLRRDGRPVTESVVQRALTTPEILLQEAVVIDSVERRITAGGDDARELPIRHLPGREGVREAPREPPRELTGPQLEVAAAVAGDRELVMVVGPAGTGKTTALRPAVAGLRAQGRVVFGVTPSAAAAEVLATDTGVDTDTIDKLLVEHRLNRPPDHRYALPPGSTLIVDEAGMVSTPHLFALFGLADRHGWRLALVGDPLQFSAIGRSGMFGYLVDQFGAVDLDRVHRFTEPWERHASLQLRCGDTSVVDLYDDHGRLHGGTPRQMARAMIDAWCDARAAGESVAMMAPTREAVVELNEWAQHRRMEAGEIDRLGPSLHAGDYQLRVGDVIATRRNDRNVHTDHGLMVKNRDHWTIQQIHEDGGLSVTGRTGRVDLAPGYVAEHVELAYAETSHANQGRTVDRSLLYLDGPTDTRGVYVPMTRGRLGNDAFVVTDGERTPADVIAEAVARTWIDRPAHEVRQELATEIVGAPRWGSVEPRDRTIPERPHRPEPMQREPDRPGPAIRAIAKATARERAPSILGGLDLVDAMRRQHELRQILDRGGISPEGRRDTLERLTAMNTERDTLAETIRIHRSEITDNQAILDRFSGPIASRLHKTPIAEASQRSNVAKRTIDSAERRITDLERQIETTRQAFVARVGVEEHRPQLTTELTGIRDTLAADTVLRAQAIEHGEVPEAVLEAIGPRPHEPDASRLWLEAAAAIDQHRTAFDITTTSALGPEPGWFDRDAYADSYRAVRDLVAGYDQAVGRTHPEPELTRTIDYPELSL